MEAVEHFDCDLASLRWCGVVDGAEPLIALPGHVHLIGGVAGLEAVPDLGPLLFGKVFDAMPEEPADLIERVMFVSAAAQGVLSISYTHLTLPTNREV